MGHGDHKEQRHRQPIGALHTECPCGVAESEARARPSPCRCREAQAAGPPFQLQDPGTNVLGPMACIQALHWSFASRSAWPGGVGGKQERGRRPPVDGGTRAWCRGCDPTPHPVRAQADGRRRGVAGPGRQPVWVGAGVPGEPLEGGNGGVGPAWRAGIMQAIMPRLRVHQRPRACGRPGRRATSVRGRPARRTTSARGLPSLGSLPVAPPPDPPDLLPTRRRCSPAPAPPCRLRKSKTTRCSSPSTSSRCEWGPDSLGAGRGQENASADCLSAHTPKGSVMGSSFSPPWCPLTDLAPPIWLTWSTGHAAAGCGDQGAACEGVAVAHHPAHLDDESGAAQGEGGCGAGRHQGRWGRLPAFPTTGMVHGG